MQSIISEDLVTALLPQKSPFQMVSQLYEFTEEGIITGFDIPEDNIFNENGFFNESGLIENIAQSIALHINYGFHLKNIAPPQGYIGTVNKVTVFELPKVNSLIRTEVKIIGEFMGITLIEGTSFQGDEKLISTQMKTVIAKD